jgi:hypothetical protein
MKVFIVTRSSDYYGEDGVVAVFDTEAKAIAFCGERIAEATK